MPVAHAHSLGCYDSLVRLHQSKINETVYNTIRCHLHKSLVLSNYIEESHIDGVHFIKQNNNFIYATLTLFLLIFFLVYFHEKRYRDHDYNDNVCSNELNTI